MYTEESWAGGTWRNYGAEWATTAMWASRKLSLAGVGTHGGLPLEPRLSSRLGFMVSKATDADVWEDLKHVRPPIYDGKPLNLDRFLEKLDDWGMTVTEDMDPAEADKYVFNPFWWHLRAVLQELYFVAAKEEKIKIPRDAKKWLKQQEQLDARHVASKMWKAIRLQHDSQEIHLSKSPDYKRRDEQCTKRTHST